MVNWLIKLAKKYKSILQAVVSLIFLWILFQQTNTVEFSVHLSNAPITHLVSWVVFYYALSGLAWGARIYILFRKFGPGTYWYLVGTGFKIQLLGTIMPGQLGDLGLMYFLKDTYTVKQSAAILLVDKLISLSITSLIAIFGIGVIFGWYYAIFPLVMLLSGICLFIGWLIWYPSLSPEGKRWARLPIIMRLSSLMNDLHDQVIQVVTDWFGITINVVLTLAQLVFAAVSLVLVLSWFGVTTDFLYVLLVQNITQLLALVPVTLMGIGLSEAVHIKLLARIDVPSDVVLAAMLAGRAIHFMIMLLVFLIWNGRKYLASAKHLTG